MTRSDVYVSLTIEINGMLCGEEAAQIAGMEPEQIGQQQEKRIEAALKNVLGSAKVEVKRVYMSVSQYKEYKNAE